MTNKKVTKKVEKKQEIPKEPEKASKEMLNFLKKHKTIISKAKLVESFETLAKRIEYIEKLEA